jgi:hypothetical protein
VSLPLDSPRRGPCRTSEQSFSLFSLNSPGKAITTTSPLSATSSPIYRRIAEEAVSSHHSASKCSGPLLGRASARPAPSPPAAEFLRYVPRHAPTPRRRWSPWPFASRPPTKDPNGYYHHSECAWDGASLVGMALDRCTGREGNSTPALSWLQGESALTPALPYRRATPHPLSTPSLAAMPPMLRPPPLRSPLSLSRGSAVSRRSPVSPRPAVSSPSGMQKQCQ